MHLLHQKIEKFNPEVYIHKNNEEMTKSIDYKFENLYRQISEMATNQAEFNSMVKQSQDLMGDSVKKQESNIKIH